MMCLNKKINVRYHFYLKILRGIVLLANKDKRELSLRTKDACQGYENISCIWTGEFPKNRKWLL